MPLGHREEFSRFPDGHFDKVPGEGFSKGGCGDAHLCVDPPNRGRHQIDEELLNYEAVEMRPHDRGIDPRRPEAREKPAFRTPHPKPRACSSAKSTRRPSSSCHVVRAYRARARRCAEPKEPFTVSPPVRNGGTAFAPIGEQRVFRFRQIASTQCRLLTKGSLGLIHF
jgi:hypothetical protein